MMASWGARASCSTTSPVAVLTAMGLYAAECCERPSAGAVDTVTLTYASCRRLPGATVSVASPALIDPPVAARISAGPFVAGGPRAPRVPVSVEDWLSAGVAPRGVFCGEGTAEEEASAGAPGGGVPLEDIWVTRAWVLGEASPAISVLPLDEESEATKPPPWSVPASTAVDPSARDAGEPAEEPTVEKVESARLSVIALPTDLTVRLEIAVIVEDPTGSVTIA